MSFEFPSQQNNNIEAVGVLDTTLSAVMRYVYLWMFAGLMITAGVAYAMLNTPLIALFIAIYNFEWGFLILLLVEFGVVIWLSAKIQTISVPLARLGFIVYAALNGITITYILLLYTEASVALAFSVTAGIFGIMAVIGYTTPIDLTKWGSYLLMGLIGFIVASVAGMFFSSSAYDTILTYVGIVLFMGLTIYDTRKIRVQVSMALAAGQEDLVQRVGIFGALSLYLDFINLFLLILRLLGRRRR